jgi:predicted membrane protein DUF2231
MALPRDHQSCAEPQMCLYPCNCPDLKSEASYCSVMSLGQTEPRSRAGVVSLVNAFVHSRDAWTSVVSTGLILSAAVVLILLFTGWMGWSMVYRHRVGVAR